MYLSMALPELPIINTVLSHVPTVGNLEELYPESFGGVSCVMYVLLENFQCFRAYAGSF